MEPNVIAPLSLDNTSVAFSDKSDAELRRMYWLFAMINRPILVKWGTSLVRWALKIGLPIKGIVKQTVFAYFCGGEYVEDCIPTVDKLYRAGIRTILDYSVEGEKNEKGFDATLEETLETILEAAKNPEKLPFCVFKVTGLAPFDLLSKVSAGTQLNTEEEKQWARVHERVDTICQKAFQSNIRILVDAEESWIQDAIDQLAYSMMKKYNQEKAVVYNTYQMYAVESLENLKKAYHQAVMHQYFLGAKVVRGAYMEKERERAEKMGYPDPIQPNKECTDRDFNDALKYCIEKSQRISLCAGTHNEDSSFYLTLLMEKFNIKPQDPRVYFSQLYGMSDNISYNLAKHGYNVAKYVPYGPVKSVMPYLFRRAEENTSVAGQSSRQFRLIQTELKRRKQAH